MMSDFEIRANNIKVAIEGARNRVEHFGYSSDGAQESVSRVIGMFISWLMSCEEARVSDLHGSCSFVNDVIKNIPEIDDPTWKVYYSENNGFSLRNRVEALWGIRIAFTHSDGDINLISNSKSKTYALNSAVVFTSVNIVDDKLILNEGLYDIAIRTMVQLREVLV